jgi:hypothetical protein
MLWIVMVAIQLVAGWGVVFAGPTEYKRGDSHASRQMDNQSGQGTDRQR